MRDKNIGKLLALVNCKTSNYCQFVNGWSCMSNGPHLTASAGNIHGCQKTYMELVDGQPRFKRQADGKPEAPLWSNVVCHVWQITRHNSYSLHQHSIDPVQETFVDYHVCHQ